MKHKHELRGALICIGVLLLLILVMMLTSCGRRQEKPAYQRRFDYVQRDEALGGSLVVYLMRDTKTKKEYAIFCHGTAMDAVEVTP